MVPYKKQEPITIREQLSSSPFIGGLLDIQFVLVVSVHVPGGDCSRNFTCALNFMFTSFIRVARLFSLCGVFVVVVVFWSSFRVLCPIFPVFWIVLS